jgi:hypothetical protein
VRYQRELPCFGGVTGTLDDFPCIYFGCRTPSYPSPIVDRGGYSVATLDVARSRRDETQGSWGKTKLLLNCLEGKGSNAPVDGILVSEPIYREVRDTFATRPHGLISAKGIAEKFETYEVLVP